MEKKIMISSSDNDLNSTWGNEDISWGNENNEEKTKLWVSALFRVFSILLILECSASVILGYNHTTKISYTEASGKTCQSLVPKFQI